MEENIDIIKELGLENLPEEEKDSLVSGLSQALQTRLSMRIMELLSKTEKTQMEELVATGDDHKVGEFVNSKVPGIDSIMRQELMKLKEELVANNELIKDAMSKKAQ
jgi:hypothetical protein